MRVLVQRVTSATVDIEGRRVGAIGQGLLLLAGVGREDEADSGAAIPIMARKIMALRIFADEAGRMNRSLIDIGGALLVVSQFTLHAEWRNGNRPSFIAAAKPEAARAMFDAFVNALRAQCAGVQTGEFGAMMQVSLVNDGPVTIWMDSAQ